ncbi:putative MFS-type transporter YxaM [Dictyobacter vulcani]|uniref:Putative MFS-type transporter YxaM n=1 Tax=Dictyobacter vulcani TaxID=2607529 RepID=A0A5J4KFN2_9CHLR|nr:MFS transporter [Dictyobacter vulcani]GER86443.1 putative MFS-type transporter YxaM [Dictyobacter vulcani]
MSDSMLEPSVTLVQKTAPKRRWLIAFFSYNSITRLVFTSAIWVIYLAAHGYSPLMIGLLEMTFHLAKFITEVPSGIFADLLGRRKSLIVYCLLGALETLFLLVPVLPLLFISFILSGISYAFLGGANEAVLWTLTEYSAPGDTQQQSVRYSKLFSLMLMLSIVSEIIGTTLGGYLGNIMQTLPFICHALACLLAIIPLLLLPKTVTEPRREPHERPHPILHFRKGLEAVWHSPRLLGLILISGLMESCGTTIYFFVQLQFQELGFALSSIGIIMSVSSLSQFGLTALAPYLMRRFSTRSLIFACVLFQAGGLLLMIIPNAMVSLVGFLTFFQAATAILYPTVSTQINERSPEAQRAMVLSFETGMFSLAMIILFPLFGLGLTTSAYSTVYSWTVLALVIGSLGTYLLVRLRAAQLRQSLSRLQQ